ncbi:inositol monophosphatase family protein [Clavibacter michiganensis]|uniref:Inositol-1-monophosphatase n=2 Tax=Clavibacter michiganensis subsp. insidiosus TaxID=33014 RepID=A0A0D5CLM8_9MICO|nr:inositol monophosphatase family protein [Clavibacter michiganensis]AJW80150.1 inositol monophosphatase [Clavibacter michiganensis subsp. insidiosus]AWF97184.1 inositol monophosphatase [Clavibacter michiganensis subsp. insidiosus]AWG02728.1 inositol monophosphatase [Clavibacter michiganensis subsp. insidiosus]OQJ58854.1 inositol monophosphatase [Clavibacter michiganensis subsp. insidiosus]RII86964.1 inositol monophosphatase [Clavibacter michiganensis subsp. insidiosus]
MTTPGDTALLTIARDIAVRAGELALRRRREGVEVAASKSSPEDIVTHTDRETEDLIRRALEDVRPDDGFLGEESEGTAGTSGLTWVVDPIDGTVNFLYGIPAWAVSIAVVEGEADPLTWTARAGCVVNPTLGEVYTATAGGGSALDGRPLAVNSGVPLSLALVGTGFSYGAETRMRQGRVITDLLGEVRDIRRIGAASLDLCNVAAGRTDAYFERGLKPWDHAAGALIAAEAGARVTGIGGGPASDELLIAADPELARALEERLERPRA